MYHVVNPNHFNFFASHCTYACSSYYRWWCALSRDPIADVHKLSLLQEHGMLKFSLVLCPKYGMHIPLSEIDIIYPPPPPPPPAIISFKLTNFTVLYHEGKLATAGEELKAVVLLWNIYHSSKRRHMSSFNFYSVTGHEKIQTVAFCVVYHFLSHVSGIRAILLILFIIF